MKFSLLYDLRIPRELTQEPLSDVYETFLDQCGKVEALGFDCIWLTEHHYSPEDQWIPAALPMCAAVAARTARIEIGTGIIALPLHDPVRIAETVAVIDQIARGRMRLGVGIGYRVEEFRTDRMDRRQRMPRLEEGVQLIQRAFSEDQVTFEGTYYQVDGLRLAPKPYRQPLPIYVAGNADSSIRRAARLGCHGFPNASRSLVEAYRDELVTNGHDPAAFEVVTFPDTLFVSEDPAGTWARWRECFMYRWEYYFKAYSVGTDLPILTLEQRERRIRESILTPAEARDFVDQLVHRAPCTEVSFFAGFPGMPLEASYESLALFSEQVMPAFRDVGPTW